MAGFRVSDPGLRSANRDSDVCVFVHECGQATINLLFGDGLYRLYMLIPPMSGFDIPQVKCNSDMT